MIRLLVDQDLNGHILDGLRRRDPTLKLVHARDVDLSEAHDPDFLEWAAAQNLVLLTDDRQTIPGFAYAPDRPAAYAGRLPRQRRHVYRQGPRTNSPRRPLPVRGRIQGYRHVLPDVSS